MISCTVSGTVGKDSVVRAAGEGQVLSFSVASNRVEKGAKLTDWVSVTLWGSRGVKLATMILKGARVVVRGSMHVREYEANGVKRASLELRADDVDILQFADRDKQVQAPDGEQKRKPREAPEPEPVRFPYDTDDGSIPF